MSMKMMWTTSQWPDPILISSYAHQTGTSYCFLWKAKHLQYKQNSGTFRQTDNNMCSLY